MPHIKVLEPFFTFNPKVLAKPKQSNVMQHYSRKHMHHNALLALTSPSSVKMAK